MKKKLLVLIVILLTLALAVPVFADPPPDEGASPGHSDGTPGEEQANENCMATWNPDTPHPQTPSGTETGNENDPKDSDSGVSNCDQWWTGGVEPDGSM